MAKVLFILDSKIISPALDSLWQMQYCDVPYNFDGFANVIETLSDILVSVDSDGCIDDYHEMSDLILDILKEIHNNVPNKKVLGLTVMGIQTFLVELG